MTRREFWKGRVVLVTGSTGFLGGWLVRRLLELGSQVLVVVRQNRAISQFSFGEFADRTRVYRGSVSDRELIKRIFTENSVEVVFHTAALTDVNDALKAPEDCFQSSVESTWWILENIRKTVPECLCVVSSSDKAYGEQEMPLRETQKLNPLHPYDVAKATQDLTAQSYAKNYGLAIGVTRCGNFFGGYDFNFNRIIPGTIRSVIEGKPPVLRSDGRFTRDFLYIEDAVDAQLLLAERMAESERVRGEAFNFSYGLEIEVLDIVSRILELMDVNVEPVIANNVVAETRYLTLSSDKARDQLDWSPQVGFDVGLQKTIDWYLDYLLHPANRSLDAAAPVLSAGPPVC